MSKFSREFFNGGRYFFASVIATSKTNEDWMLAVDDDGYPFVAKPAMGHMMRTEENPDEHQWCFLQKKK